jgi:hypothetical protein
LLFALSFLSTPIVLGPAGVGQPLAQRIERRSGHHAGDGGPGHEQWIH